MSPTPTDRDELLPLISDHELQNVTAEILAASKPSIRLISAKGQQALPFSRLGGRPLLPPSLSWPKHDERSLTFIAQIQLSELEGLEVPAECPRQGRLYFFCDVHTVPPSGWSVNEAGGWRVLFTPVETEPLTEAPAPPELESHELLKPLSITTHQAITIPTTRSIELSRLPEMDDDTWNRYYALHDALWQESPQHRLFGHPFAIQGCMQRTAQFISAGETLPEGVHSWYEHPRAAELMPGAYDWILLLQADSDTGNLSECYWGDNGLLYYWIKRSDLAAGRFDRVWFFMQCY